MNLSALLDSAQSFVAQQMPGTIAIDGVSYACGTTGAHREKDLLSGGWLNKFHATFWLPSNAFTSAGKPLPKIRKDAVTFLGVIYEINALPATNGATIALKCTTPD